MVTPPQPPTVNEVRALLIDILAHRVSWEYAADWAAQWVVVDEPTVEDEKVWRALTQIVGADSRVSPVQYLHTEPDFHAWLDALEC